MKTEISTTHVGTVRDAESEATFCLTANCIYLLRCWVVFSCQRFVDN